MTNMNINGTLSSSARILIIVVLLTALISACTSSADSSSSETVPAPIEGSCRCEESTKWPNSVGGGVGEYGGLSIEVRDHEDFNVRTHLRPDGMIALPRVGNIDAKGKTIFEVRDTIAEKPRKFIQDPIVDVTVTISNCEGDRVRVVGAVQQVISMSCRLDMTVLSAVRSAGGVTEFADLSNVRLYHRDGSFLRVRLDHILAGSDTTTNYAIRAGDVLTVPRKPCT